MKQAKRNLKLYPSLIILAVGMTSLPSLAVLDGSSSMRVDVEVYKGPLSKEIDVQAFELAGKIRESRRTFAFLSRSTSNSMALLDCAPDSSINNLSVAPRKASAEQVKNCTLLQEFYIDARTAVKKAEDLEYMMELNGLGNTEVPGASGCGTVPDPATQGKSEKESQQEEQSNESCTPSTTVYLDRIKGYQNRFDLLLNQTVSYAEWLRSRAAFWATTHAVVWPEDKRVRIDQVGFTQFAADYGNQIGARADALIKQLRGVEGYRILRDQLASTTFLRDSNQTRFVNLYDWNNATVDNQALEGVDRVRMVEQLTNDTYWAKINSVFAAGQGKVHSVLIKDDIGNWNLKSFDNSPQELLQAYKKVGYAALSTAASLASSGASRIGENLSKAQKTLALADQVALGADPNATGLRTQIDSYREALQARLAAVAADYTKMLGDLNAQEPGREADNLRREQDIATAKAELQSLEEEFESAETRKKAAEKELSDAQSSGNAPDTAVLLELHRKLQLTTASVDTARARRDGKARELAALELQHATINDAFNAQKETLEQTTRTRLRDAVSQYRATLQSIPRNTPPVEGTGDAGSTNGGN